MKLVGPLASMHGPAVASLLVGEWCGTAPGARLHLKGLLFESAHVLPSGEKTIDPPAFIEMVKRYRAQVSETSSSRPHSARP